MRCDFTRWLGIGQKVWLSSVSLAAMTFAASPASAQVRLPVVQASHAPTDEESLEARMMRLEQMFSQQVDENRLLRERIESLAAPDAGTGSMPSTAPVADDYHVVGTDKKLNASWRHGVEIESENKDFRLHIGGRIQIDSVWLDDDPVAYTNAGGIGDADSVNFRRGRIRLDGNLYQTIEWASEWDFVNHANLNQNLPAPNNAINEATSSPAPAPTDQWVTFHELPVVGNFRIGQFKDPVGMEHLTSSRYLDFMERSYNQDAFYGPFNNGFMPGIMIYDTWADQNGTWSLGGFKSNALSNPFGYDTGDGEYEAAGRVTWLPWYDVPAEGRYLLHLGLSGVARDTNDAESARVRARGSLRNGPPGPLNPVFADSGTFSADTQSLLNGEFAWQNGPLLVQSEYTAAFFDNAEGGLAAPAGELGTYFAHGWYVQALYFLTGEHRGYDRQAGVFGRVIPHNNFYMVRGVGICGPGAWQVGARYSHLDLTDSGIDGGVLDDVTLGLNWFLNPNLKFQWNYAWTHREVQNSPLEADFHGFGGRLAWDF